MQELAFGVTEFECSGKIDEILSIIIHYLKINQNSN
jgi:hypothetical protein